MLFQTGSFSMGESRHDLATSLYVRIERISRVDGFDLPAEQRAQRKISVGEFFRHVAEHPRATMKTASSDISNLTLNSGANQFLGRYLQLFDMPRMSTYWRDIRDKGGFWAMVRGAYDYSAALFFINLVATPLWVGFLAIAVFGAVVLLRHPGVPPAVKALIVGFPLYIVVTAPIIGSPRWGHRTPMDFVLALLFAAAVVHLLALRVDLVL